MDLYCLLTDLNQSKYCIVPTQNVFELNEKNNLKRIRSDTYQADKKYYVTGASLQIGIGGFYIIDSHDDYKVLRKRNPVDSRIILAKLPDYSPLAESQVSKKAGTSKISNSEQVVKNPDVPRKSTKKSTVAIARKDNELNSADYYMEQEIATGSGNTRETGIREVTEEGTSKDNNSELPEIAEETRMAAPGNRDNRRNNVR
ncbi:GSCOCG00012231001-RA-CDS [Cotesia congregata]|nr:GSCOCG00012231001-RA-CDS [Cotesia congregata]